MRTETVLGIHLNVRSDITKKIQGIQKEFGLVYPGNYQHEPHVTIYLSRFAQSDFTILQKKIIAAKLRPIRLIITGLSLVPYRRGIFVSLGMAESTEIKRFHMKIIRIANRLRGNRLRSKDLQRIREKVYTPQEIIAIQKYGYLRVGSRFHPHVTLGNTPTQYKQTSRLQKKAQMLKGGSFMAKEVVIGLYAYDKSRHDYTGVIRERAIPLGA